MPKTFASALARHGNVGPGFDAVRLALASGVIIWHCWPITSGDKQPPAHGPVWGIVYLIVPMFFALSGFLVAGSASRLSLLDFATSRALRILPALTAVTAASILLIGMTLTSLPRLVYITRPETMLFWLNSVGLNRPTLPGVFEHNPSPLVNASLWTIPWEICSYILMGFLLATGRARSALAPMVGILALFAVEAAYRSLPVHIVFEKQIAGDGGKLVCFFLAGAALYNLRNHVRVSSVLAGGCAAFIIACAFTGGASRATETWFEILSVPVLAYLVIWLGLQPIRLPKALNGADLSYGVYICGFPIQQAVVAMTGTHQPLIVLVIAAPMTLLAASISWRFVESPALRLRKLLRRPSRWIFADNRLEGKA